MQKSILFSIVKDLLFRSFESVDLCKIAKVMTFGMKICE